MENDELKRIAVVIMAKAPRAGEVKTRLSPPLTNEEAAELSRCFLIDKIEQVKSLEEAEPAIAYYPEEGRVFFEEYAPGFVLVPQNGPDLGARLANCFDRMFEKGYPGALAIDSDTPTLPTAYLRQAIDLMISAQNDLVMGPSDDGGYYLIGMRRAHPELFQEIPWSTSRVTPETIRRAQTTRLKVAMLPTWYDIDTPEDLKRLQVWSQRSEGVAARQTRRFFKERRKF